MMKRITFFIWLLTGLAQFVFVSRPAGQEADIYTKQILADSLYARDLFEEAAVVYAGIYSSLTDDTEDKGKSAYRAGKSYKQSGELKNAKLWFSHASDIFSRLKHWDNHFIAMAELADLADDNGDYGYAISVGEKVVAHFEKQKDSLYAAKNLNNLALYHYHSGNIQRAIELYIRGIDWAGDKDNALKAKVYNQLGNIWADDFKDEQKALSYYRQSLQLKLSSATPQSVSAAYNNIGISHKNLGNTDSALYYYDMALDYAMKSNLPKAKVNPLINIANLYKKQHNTEEAIKVYTQVLDLAEYMTIRQQVNIYTNLGIAYNEWENYPKALHFLSVAEGLANKDGSLTDRADVQIQLALAHRGIGNFEKAWQAQANYTALADSINVRMREQEIAELMMKYESAEKDIRILEQQHNLQKKALEMHKRTLWLGGAIAMILAFSGILFLLFKRKEAAARQASVELRLAEQKEIARIQEERLRISRELHDNIGSYLTLLSASVEQVSAAHAVCEACKIPDLKDTLSMSMRELRKTVWLLNKDTIEVDEISVRLRDFFKPLHQNGTRIVVTTEGDTRQKLTEIQTTHLFRIIQEATNNAYRYAGGTRITVHLKVGADRTMCFTVEDNGKGFDTSDAGNGNGLRNMTSRMEELKGKLSIVSHEGAGTTVEGCFAL